MLKNFFIFVCLVLLSNCSIPNSAFLGPIYTGVKTGSVYQTSISYSSGRVINKIKLKNTLNQTGINEFFSKNPILPDIPYVNKNPQILLAYKVEKVIISDVAEPETLP